jgi:hypothetical protein
MSDSTINNLICVGAVVAVIFIWGITDVLTAWAKRNRPRKSDKDE